MAHTRFIALTIALALVSALLGLSPAVATSEGVIEVDRVDDDPAATACTPAANDCSLRGSFLHADAVPGDDVIHLPESAYHLTTQGKGEDAGMTGDIDIHSNVTLRGDTQDGSLIYGDGNDRIFDIVGVYPTNSYEVLIEGVQLATGNATDGGGGAIRNAFSKLTVLDASIVMNVGTFGGGISSGGGKSSLTVVRSTIDHNQVQATHGGGGIFVDTTQMVMRETTVSNNEGGRGGGIENAGANVTITNSTITGNQATEWGGGIYSNAALTLNHVTITGNVANSNSDSAGFGGGIDSYNNGTVMLSSSILSGNSDESPGTDDECAGDFTSGGYNVLGHLSATCQFTGDTATDLKNKQPELGPLQYNGGHHLYTMLPNPSSAAIDAVPINSCPPLDERTFARPAGAACDAGAVEVDAVEAQGESFVWGDNFCDGTANNADSLAPLEFLAGVLPSLTAGCLAINAPIYLLSPDAAAFWADVNCDGRVDALDTLYALQKGSGSAKPLVLCPTIGDSVAILAASS